MTTPAKTIQVLGFDVPVLDVMLLGEAREIQTAKRRWEIDLAGPLQQSLETAEILIRHRLGKTMPVFDPYKPPPFDPVDLEQAVVSLVGPFLAYEARASELRRARVKDAGARTSLEDLDVFAGALGSPVPKVPEDKKN